MADVVIVAGARRGNSRVPISEIKQMIGRSGRDHKGEQGVAYILVDDADAADVENELENREGMDIVSQLAGIEPMVFHVLAEFHSGDVACADDINRWFSRSFAAFQGKTIDSDAVIRYLLDCGAVVAAGGKYVVTTLGKAASRLYFPPESLWLWRKTFEDVFNAGLDNSDAAVAWALGHVSVQGAVQERFFEVIDKTKDDIPPGFTLLKGNFVSTALWYAAMGCVPSAGMRTVVLGLRDDVRRIMTAMGMIFPGRKDYFEKLGICISRGMGADVFCLMGIDGMTLGLAKYLVGRGIKTPEMLAVTNEVDVELDMESAEKLESVVNEARRMYGS